jgi:UDPglucose 6-dehydrogenase
VLAGRLQFATTREQAQHIAAAKCVFIAVGTPQDDEGRADLTWVEQAIDGIAPHLAADAIVVIKSTVPPGTNRNAASRLRELCGREVDVASNPEFLKEGCAIADFTKPDRVVVGVTRPETAEVLRELYAPFLRTEKPFLVMGLESAELTKYVANCLLAAKISFINEMANLCDALKADVNDVRRGIGTDRRIGFEFLFPGVGYGGSCFPKDVRATINICLAHGVEPRMLTAVDTVNEHQKVVLFDKISRYFRGALSGRTIAQWGLAFKAGTDDTREAPSFVLIENLLKAGATIRVHDPAALDKARRELKDMGLAVERVVFCERQYDALNGACALAVVTDWSEYRNPNFALMRQRLADPVIFDGRNLYDRARLAEMGFYHEGIGLPPNSPG